MTKFALDNARVTWLFVFLAVLAGTLSFRAYPKQEDPSMLIREAVVTARFPGMSTQRVEDLITRPLEEKIREIGEVSDILSDSKPGVSVIHVKVHERYSDLEPIWQDLRNRMSDFAPNLPEGTLGPFVNDEFGLTAVASIALWADGFSLAEMRQVARDVRDRLYALPGIKKVELHGIQEERVYLEYENAKLAQYGLSPRTFVDALRQQNIILPGGSINAEGQRKNIEPSGNLADLSAIQSVLLPVPGTGKTVPLRDVLTMTRGYVDPADAPVYYNGRPAIVLSVSLTEGVDSVAFGKLLKRKAAELEQELPIGYVLDFATFQPELVNKAVNGAVNNLYQTLGIVLAVVMVFLGLRTGVIVGAFVPLAMLLGLVVMSMAEIEFQRMSIAAMIIALGMLVDNGIVMAEEIRSRMEKGQERRAAAIAAGGSLAIPLLTSSLTTILAFMPMYLAIGGAGEYTRSLSQVVIIVLLSSWFLAMTVTPVMCVKFIKLKPRRGGRKGMVKEASSLAAYRKLLEGALRRRGLVLLLVVALMAGIGYLSRYVVQEFFPPGDRNQFLVYLYQPAGTHIDETSRSVRELADWLGDAEVNPEVDSTIAYVGDGGPRFFLSLGPLDPDPHVAFMVVTTETREQVPEMTARVKARTLSHHPDLRAEVKAMWLGPSETGLVQVRLTGPDAEVLSAKADAVIAGLRAIPGTDDIKNDWENKVITIEVKIDQSQARRVGVTSEDVARSLNAFYDGAAISDYREGDTVIPIVVRGNQEERNTLADIYSLNIYAEATGRHIPLNQIAEPDGRWDYSRIKRRNQERTVTVSAKHQFLKAAQVIDRLGPTLAALDLPPGHRWEMGGELEESAKAQGFLFANMPLCGGLIVFLLVWQFNSFRRTLIILVTIPLAFMGAILGLLAMDAVFGFMAMLGLLSLAGIIINNGIVLIDRIDSERTAGKEPYDAVVSAAVSRLRPIVMTTLTTMLGLLPLILSRDPLFYGMANVIAFGMALGTLLTLGLVPVVYTLLFRVKIPAP